MRVACVPVLSTGTLEQREQGRMMSVLYPKKSRLEIAEEIEKMGLRENASMDEFGTPQTAP